MLVILSDSLAEQQSYEGYYLYIDEYPKEESPGYHEDVQGLTHDGNNWFITQSDADDSDQEERSLWKIPMTIDLNNVSDHTPYVPPSEYDYLVSFKDVHVIYLDNIPDLANQSYNHFGDLSYYKYENSKGNEIGYLVVAVEGMHHPPVMAVFRSDDLFYIGKAPVEQNGAGWAAIDPAGYVYSSSSITTSFFKYKLDWEALESKLVKLTRVDEVKLSDEEGKIPLTLTHVQGGVFTESGNLLYVTSGLDDRFPNDGINVFDTQTWKRVQSSTNGPINGAHGHFDYQFYPGGTKGQEPEGLTIWDLDDGKAPFIGGQLHVLMLDNDWPDDDDIYIKHYTGTMYVDHSYTGAERGIRAMPIKTITKSIKYWPVWDGAQIKIKAGSYPEKLKISKRIKMIAYEGPVIIGK